MAALVVGSKTVIHAKIHPVLVLAEVDSPCTHKKEKNALFVYRSLGKERNVCVTAVHHSAIVPDHDSSPLTMKAMSAGGSTRGTHGSHVKESDEAFDARYESYLSRPDIDGWEIRKAMNDLQGEDLVPEPKIIIAAMKACRRVNDYALAVRYLEAVQASCGGRVKEIWPYIRQEIQPTLDDLGILTPEDMNYDKPELALEDVYDM